MHFTFRQGQRIFSPSPAYLGLLAHLSAGIHRMPLPQPPYLFIYASLT